MVIIKQQEEIRIMRESGRIVAEVLQLLKEKIRPGITTKALDEMAESWIRRRGAIPSFLGYPQGSRNPFPASICASLNEELVHGIPGPRVLEEGDLLTVDVGAFYKGYHGDSAWTFPVGEIAEDAQVLMEVTKSALFAGIRQAVPGNHLGDISAAVQEHIESRGYYITRQYTGHGIGQRLHEEPQVLNYGIRGQGIQLHQGMAICIEPMVLVGTSKTQVLKDRWTVVSANKKLTAHFEHTIALTDGEPVVLTQL